MITHVISKRLWSVSKLLVVVAILASSGCGGVVYAVRASSAASNLEQAEQLQAPQLAPFEYYLAQQHLLKARQEAADGSYGDANELADDANTYAEKAIRLSREAHRGAGR